MIVNLTLNIAQLILNNFNVFEITKIAGKLTQIDLKVK